MGLTENVKVKLVGNVSSREGYELRDENVQEDQEEILFIPVGAWLLT